ncbi:glycosyltransferase family 39 protein [Butyrivibrio sp. WCE2006]|uniref:glycosyltransferase family 39 protein n=1 Tax=Butyrivibrio sp. WCE2006 TaxID=1410611 RepID=UPI0005D219DC|nr:glycosyltransferase family 39 protein [Butyrivibrio sp. WCE2006]
MKNIEKVILTFIIFVTMGLIILFGLRKVNYHCDEIWTYGLANNIGGISPNFEIGKAYSGMGPFESFTEVLNGEAFSYANVWENQAKDVHPPFYYILIHTISSVFRGSFSKWYGIGLNIFWMILILVFLYMLTKDIAKNTTASFGVIIAYATSVVFMDTMLLIRMYAQFTFFVILLIYLFEKNWDKKPEKQFLIKLCATLFLGMLTHYYFLFIAFFMCLVYGIRLIIAKNKTDIRNYIISLGIAGLSYGIVWYHIIAHIFNGYRGAEAISKATSFGGLISGFIGMCNLLNEEAFAGLIIVFIILCIIFLFLHIKEGSLRLNFTGYLFLCGVFYVLIVGKICPKITTRYIMPIAWIFIMCAFIAFRYILNIFVKSSISEYIVIALFCLLSVVNIVTRNFYVPMDYYNADQMAAIECAEGKNAVVYIDVDWKILYDFVILQKADSYIFADEESFQQIIDEQKDDYIVIINVDDNNDNHIETLDAQLLYEDGNNFYYLVKK